MVVAAGGAFSASPWVIVGCGYTGERLAARLVGEGAQVTVTRRREGDARAVAARVGGAARAAQADISAPEGYRELVSAIPSGAIVVDSVPPRADGGAGDRRLARAAADAGARRLVYLSSTGVYPSFPPGGAAWVDEDTPAAPESEHGARRLEAETAVLEEARARGLSAVSLRVAAIYGPGRGVHARMRAGTYRIVGEGDTYVSRVHVDDLATAVCAAGAAASLPRAVYTVADDEPTTAAEFAEVVANILDVAPPPRVSPDEVSARARSMLAANRKVSSRRLREDLGVALRYPGGPDGVRAALEEERARERAGP